MHKVPLACRSYYYGAHSAFIGRRGDDRKAKQSQYTNKQANQTTAMRFSVALVLLASSLGNAHGALESRHLMGGMKPRHKPAKNSKPVPAPVPPPITTVMPTPPIPSMPTSPTGGGMAPKAKMDAPTMMAMTSEKSAKKKMMKKKSVKSEKSPKKQPKKTKTKRKKFMMTPGKGKGKGKGGEPVPSYCGCAACTDAVWETPVNGETCGEKITYLQTQEGLPEMEACTVISNIYYGTCGPYCNPHQCDATAAPTLWNNTTDAPSLAPVVAMTDSPTVAPVVTMTDSPTMATTDSPTASQTDTPTLSPVVTTTASPSAEDTDRPTDCGCPECTAEVLDTDIGGFTCGERIAFLQTPDGGDFPETDACAFVANEFTDECGLCDPVTCNTVVTSSPTTSPTDGPTTSAAPSVSASPTTSAAPSVSSSPTTSTAPSMMEPPDDTSAPTTAPVETTTEPTTTPATAEPTTTPATAEPTSSPVAATAAPTTTPVATEPTCGCDDCTAEILGLDAGGISCGDRINLFQDPEFGGLTESEACLSVASEFATTCGPACNPTLCDGQAPSATSEPAPLVCGCTDCTADLLGLDTGGLSCGARISFLQSPDGGGISELEACSVVTAEFPTICGPGCDPALCDGA